MKALALLLALSTSAVAAPASMGPAIPGHTEADGSYRWGTYSIHLHGSTLIIVQCMHESNTPANRFGSLWNRTTAERGRRQEGEYTVSLRKVRCFDV